MLRKAKAKGLSYVAVRASQFNKSPRKTTSPLVIPKNAPRPAKVPDASRAVVAEAIMRSSYQVTRIHRAAPRPSRSAVSIPCFFGQDELAGGCMGAPQGILLSSFVVDLFASPSCALCLSRETCYSRFVLGSSKIYKLV